MNEEPKGPSAKLHLVVVTVIAVYIALSLYALIDLRVRLIKLERRQVSAEEELSVGVKVALSALKQSSEMLAEKMGRARQQLAAQSAALQKQSKAAEELAAQQQEAQRKIGAVSGEVAGVKGDIGGVRSDVAATRSELEATRARLERAIGDLGVQSGLIARTRGELEALKQRGERNYYEFTLARNQRPTPLATVSLQLKKTDPKHSKFTLNVLADDRTIEKKDRGVNEPLQFYTGRDRQLYEVVVNSIDKDKVSGYLSTPRM